MRGHTRVWETPNKRNPRPAYSVKTGFLRGTFPMLAAKEASGKWVLICCACSLLKTKERTGKEWNGNEKRNTMIYYPKGATPLHETVCYKIGGTIFEIETLRRLELLYDKMTRLIKEETVETPADKEIKERYNSDSNLFVGRSLQEE